MNVWVVSGLAVERALIVAELAEEGFDARGLESLADLWSALAEGQPPQVLIIDAGVLESHGDEAEVLNRMPPSARKILIAGASTDRLHFAHVLRRPISIGELTSRIRSIVGGTP